MKIRETTAIAHSTKADRQALTVDAIEELDQQYADGEIERHAYIIKKRALLRML